MSGETTRPVGTQIAEDGIPYAHTVTSPTDNKVRAQCKVPPETVVPVIFVPGIMGSNLRIKDGGKNIWGLDSKIGMFFQWCFRSSSTRQSTLIPDEVEVDPNGGFPGPSATVPNAEVAKQRGWGQVAKMSYGPFLRWLDDELNADLCSSSTPSEGKSPWARYENDKDIGNSFGAEKPFEPISTDESNHAWSNFFCPVHAVGYNWLKSNGDSGMALVDEIHKIIDYWNSVETDGHKHYTCMQVILVSHSMGGLVTRAAAHSEFGGTKDTKIADKIVGIVHGEQPANGAAAAYHHCRSGYNGLPGIVLGRNAAQVTAVFANSPGAMELLPNHQYPKQWLKVTVPGSAEPVMQLPNENPYDEIYSETDAWWRLVDPNLIDPSRELRKIMNPSDQFIRTLKRAKSFHSKLNTKYHSPTYVHYSADRDRHPAYGDLVWSSSTATTMRQAELQDAKPNTGSNPVTIHSSIDQSSVRFQITDPKKVGYPQPGDETVPACSGEAPNTQGGFAVKQSFRMNGFEHQDAYNNGLVREATLYAIGKVLQSAKKS
jgi:pimeloyl-ACP methyl ester carboxylesterase